MSSEIVKDISTDQCYLYEICQAVSAVAVTKELSMRSVEALHYGR